MQWKDLALPSWKIFFAIVAILDISTCWPVLHDGWILETPQKQQRQRQHQQPECQPFEKNKLEGLINFGRTKGVNDEEVCVMTTYWNFIGIFFCCLCVGEALIRAKEAREIAYETAALDNFEKKLARLYSTTRCSVFRKQPGVDDYEQGYQDLVLARNTLRVWTPVISVLLSWFILIPWKTFFGNSSSECGGDTALATVWLVTFINHTKVVLHILQSKISSFLWRYVFPSWKTALKPKKVIKRLKEILRILRYFRFAGPLLRLGLKLQDQFWVFTTTWRQAFQAKTERARRIAHRSLLFDDIKKIESFAKIRTTLSSIPSQLQLQTKDLRNKFMERRVQAKKLKHRLDSLKEDIARSSVAIPSSEIYDQIIDLTQELKTTVSTAILSSNLVSPHTRFSVGWRVIVTFALLSELFRLYWSWHLSGTFDVSLTHMISSLLVECDQKMMERFRIMTRKGKPLRRFIGKVFHLKNVELAECMPTSQSSRLVLRMGRIFESTIDVVCFLDIFVWFFTGELDTNGVVIPKPFFYRCILPGTLAQIVDHPTLPDKLPHLIYSFIDATRWVGYGRAIRWALAISPAFEMMVVHPIKLYLFRPMGNDEYLKYVESITLIPQAFSQPTFSHTSMRRLSSYRSGMLAAYPSYGGKSDGHSSRGNLEDYYSVGYNFHY